MSRTCGRSLVQRKASEVTPSPTLPERDNFYELGLVQRFGVGDRRLKLSGYRKESSPGIDDNTVPGSAIVTSVNIDQVQITGIESVCCNCGPPGPISGYLNVALNHAYGPGLSPAGFFPEDDDPTGYFDLDHDQRLSAVGSVDLFACRDSTLAAPRSTAAA